jgi:hypothetical protein
VAALTIAVAVDEDHCRSSLVIVQEWQWQPSTAVIAVYVFGNGG